MNDESGSFGGRVFKKKDMERWWSPFLLNPKKEVELLAVQDIKHDGENHLGIRKQLIQAYIKGFRKSEELNNKKYSKLQILKAVQLARGGQSFTEIIKKIEE